MSGKTYIGTDRIKHIYTGTDKIKHIYVGTDCVFSAELEYTVVSGTAPTLSGDKSGNWELTFTGNCELEILSVPEDTIDAFGVGGGGGAGSVTDGAFQVGGGGGGYTKSVGSIPLTVGDHIIVSIGTGGAGGTGYGDGSNGNPTTIAVNSTTKLTASGGYGSTSGVWGNGIGANGGSGGGGNGGCASGQHYSYILGGRGGNGGTNGANGDKGANGEDHYYSPYHTIEGKDGGTGQGYPTTAFYELGVDVGTTSYAPGGGGKYGIGQRGGGVPGDRGAGDTHGAGGNGAGGSGYSGIAIIRNHR